MPKRSPLFESGSGKDKGGPSKGGFLNNRFFLNNISFVYTQH